jgi:phosphatidylserine/phosphatidylglycerophosphate/cardiolipin synthase-like enzyme
MVSDWSLTRTQSRQLKSLVALPNVTVKYLSFPTHTEGYVPYSRVSHTKALMVDGTHAWVGSANWQPGYFIGSRNVGVVTSDPSVTHPLRRYFLTAWTSHYARPLELYSTPRVPFHQ